MTCKLIGPSFESDWLVHYWQNKMFADTRIYCSNGILNQAHRMVLAVGSRHFNKLLKEVHDSDEAMTTIVMPEFSTQELKQLLSQFYGILVKDIKSTDLKEPKTTDVTETKTTDFMEPKTTYVKEPNNIDIKRTKISLFEESKTVVLEENKTTILKHSKTAVLNEMKTAFPADTKTAILKEMKTEVHKMSKYENFENYMDNIDHSNSRVEFSSRNSSQQLNKSKQVTSNLNSGTNSYHKKDLSSVKMVKPLNKIGKPLKVPDIFISEKRNILRKPEESNLSDLLRKEGNIWICSIDGCVYQHNQKQYVKIHINTHQEKRVCDWCGASIAVNNLTRHIKRMHTKDVKMHKCDQCDYESIETERLKAHMSKHHGAPRRFQCPACGDCFHGHKDLSKHKYIKHSERKRYRCDDCSKEFKHSTNYNNHIKMHKGIRPFQCKICNFCFTRKDKLNEHVNRHTGEKPFKCDKCTFTFGNSSALSVHRKSHNYNSIMDLNLHKKLYTTLDGMK